MQIIKVKLPENVCIYLEKLIFESNSYKNILNYLCNEKNSILLDKYFKEAREKDIELNLCKTEIEKSFCPEELNSKTYRYNIDYHNYEIIYEVIE